MYLTLFVDRSHLLTQMVLKPGHVAPRLKSKLQNDRYEITMSSMQWILSLLCIFLIFFFPLSSTRNVTVLTTSNTAGDLKQTETHNHSRVPCFISVCFCFMCMICRSLFVFLYFFLWPLCCMFFLDIRILIIPLVSSNSFVEVRATHLISCLCCAFCWSSLGALCAMLYVSLDSPFCLPIRFSLSFIQ